MAPYDLAPGSFYPVEIIKALNRTTVFVLLLSANSNGSFHVLREVERAASKQVRLVTVRLDDCVLTEGFEYFLSISQQIPRQGAFDAIVESAPALSLPEASRMLPAESPLQTWLRGLRAMWNQPKQGQERAESVAQYLCGSPSLDDLEASLGASESLARELLPLTDAQLRSFLPTFHEPYEILAIQTIYSMVTGIPQEIQVKDMQFVLVPPGHHVPSQQSSDRPYYLCKSLIKEEILQSSNEVHLSILEIHHWLTAQNRHFLDWILGFPSVEQWEFACHAASDPSALGFQDFVWSAWQPCVAGSNFVISGGAEDGAPPILTNSPPRSVPVTETIREPRMSFRPILEAKPRPLQL